MRDQFVRTRCPANAARYRSRGAKVIVDDDEEDADVTSGDYRPDP